MVPSVKPMTAQNIIKSPPRWDRKEDAGCEPDILSCRISYALLHGSFNDTAVQLRVFVIADAHQHDLAGIAFQCLDILLFFDL